MSEVNGRTLLTRLGIPDATATLCVPYLFISPMTTDPKAAQIILMVRAIQAQLNMMGAGIVETGYLDQPTADALTQLCGSPDWHSWAWSDVVATVLANAQNGTSLAATEVPYPIAATGDVASMPFGLPDVPGGMITYAIGGYFLFKALKKGKR